MSDTPYTLTNDMISSETVLGKAIVPPEFYDPWARKACDEKILATRAVACSGGQGTHHNKVRNSGAELASTQMSTLLTKT
jgi:hypothetical protein